MQITFEDLCIPFKESMHSYLEDHSYEAKPGSMQEFFLKKGYLILNKFIPDTLIENYRRIRDLVTNPTGWETGTPYMQHTEIKDLGCYGPLHDVMFMLTGERMAMHLNLTGYVSTERNWHQDIYLNPTYVGSAYLALWVALEDIHPDSGPFEYIPGSHLWGCMNREKTLSFLTPEERKDSNWPRLAERFVNDACAEEIKQRGAPIRQFIPKKGDILLWHSRLMHRGSAPKVPGTQRRAFIAHYSSIKKRRDMPYSEQHKGQGYFFVL